jgi:hypothetical protein
MMSVCNNFYKRLTMPLRVVRHDSLQVVIVTSRYAVA